jgi:hypothetical protein
MRTRSTPSNNRIRPEQVDELRGEKQCAERYARRRALGGERDPEMADEHSMLPGSA